MCSRPVQTCCIFDRFVVDLPAGIPVLGRLHSCECRRTFGTKYGDAGRYSSIALRFYDKITQLTLQLLFLRGRATE